MITGETTRDKAEFLNKEDLEGRRLGLQKSKVTEERAAAPRQNFKFQKICGVRGRFKTEPRYE